MKNSLKILNQIMMACRVSLYTCGHKLKWFIFAFQLPLILLRKIEPKIWAPKPRQSLGSRHSQAKSYFLIRVPCVCCHIAEGSIKHLFWFCPKLHNFWSAIFEQLPESLCLTMTRPSLDALPRLPAFRMTRRPLCTSGCWWLGYLSLISESLPLHLSLVQLLKWKDRAYTHQMFDRIRGPFLSQWQVWCLTQLFTWGLFHFNYCNYAFPQVYLANLQLSGSLLDTPFPFHLFSFMFDSFLWHVLWS